MTTATAEPLTRDAIDKILAQLTDDQKRYVLVKLLRPVLAPIKERRAIFDEAGQLLGDYVPFPRVQPGQKVGMLDEARAALAGMPRMTLAEWRRRERENAKADGTIGPTE